jgi:hydroxymethylglutaryl-CoA lyase
VRRPRGRIRLVEVGPRDGLQNERTLVKPEGRAAFIEALADAGFSEIEAGAFVAPRAIPQLADTDEVFRLLKRRPGIRYSALVPNERGLERAIKSGARRVAVFTAASETFNRKNINATIAESFERFRPVLARTRSLGISVRGYVSTVFWCPYEGEVAPEAGIRVAEELLGLGCEDVSLGDTTGHARPGDVETWLAAANRRLPMDRVAFHFHDTFGMGVANVAAALAAGVRAFDASAGGLGGCPYAPGAAGNVATEDVLYLLEGMGYETGVRLDALVQASSLIEGLIGRSLPSKVYRAFRAGAATSGLPAAGRGGNKPASD